MFWHENGAFHREQKSSLIQLYFKPLVLLPVLSSFHIALKSMSLVQADPGATPGYAPGETPAMGATPTPKRGRSRWDETPAGAGMGATPAQGPSAYGATPMMGAGATPMQTPMGGMDMQTPTPSQLQSGQVTPEQYQVSISGFCSKLLDEKDRYFQYI